MKNLKFSNIIIGLLVLTFAVSCRPDVDEFVLQEVNSTTQLGRPITNDSANWFTQPAPTALVNQMFDALEVPFTTTTVSVSAITAATQTIELRTPDHVLISIPANSLRIAGATSVPTGNIVFKYRSLLKKGDFVRTSMPTMSNGLPLVSGGSVQVLATLNGQPITLSGNTMRIRIPAPNNQVSTQMQFFVGDTIRDVNWQLIDTTRISPATWIDSLRQPSTIAGYECFSNRFRWVNCDYFWGVSPRGRACVKMDTLTYHPQNTAVFAVFTNANVVMRIHPSAPERMWCSPNMPLSEPVTYVTLTRIDSTYYLGTQAFPTGVSQSPITRITPTQRTLQEILAFLAGL
jgi:hypothetical protein